MLRKSNQGLVALALPIVGALTLSSCGLFRKITGSEVQSLALDEGPRVTITAPPEGTFITTTNFEAFTLTGFCSYEGGQVTVATSVPVFGSSPCTANSWTVTLDVSFLFDGPLQFDVNHFGPLGEGVPTFTRVYVKDTLSPSGASVVIGDGATPPRGPAVVLALEATGASRMYITNTPGCASGGALQPYATTANWMIQPIGTAATVYAQFYDDAGNKSPCVSDTIPVDFAPPPTVAILNPPMGTVIGAAMVSGFALSGTCSENGRPVAIAGSATGAASCAGGAWTVSLNIAALPDGPLAFTATHANAFGSSATAFVSYMKDTGAPTVAILAPAAGSYVNLANQAVFSVSGSCSENGRPVVLSGAAAANASCAANAWTATLDLTGAPEGNLVLTANHSDVAGNAAAPSARVYLKDTIAPAGTISINGGAAVTAVTAVTLTLASPDAAAMYVTNVAGCLTGGAFEPYATAKPWTIAQTNATATVYVAFRDVAGNVGPCASDTIIHSNQPLAIAPASVSLPSNVAQTVNFSASGGAGGYVFTVRSGEGTIVAATGVYTVAAGATGMTVVRVTDASGATADATINHALQKQLVFDGPVKAIGIDADGNRYYGGNFTRIAGATTPGLIALDASGNPDGGFNPLVGFDGAVLAILHLPDGSILVGGDFRTYRGAPARGIARLGGSGALDGGFSPPTGPNGFDGAVHALAFDPATNAIFAGGKFRKYRGAPSPGVAKLSLAGAIDPVFNPASGPSSACVDANVYALAIADGYVYVGGDFTRYRNLPARAIAKVSVATGALDAGFNPSAGANGFDGEVRALVADGARVYAGGTFRRYRGLAASAVARLNANGTLDTSFSQQSAANGCAGGNGHVYALALGTDGLYIGGDFDTYRGDAARNLAKAKLDGTNDDAFQAVGENGTRGSVTGLAFRSGSLYVAGPYTHYRARAMNGIAKVDGGTGVVDAGFNAAGLGFSREGAVPPIAAVAVSMEDGQVVVGGDLAGGLYEGTVSGRLVKVKATGMVDLDFAARAKVDGEVDAIAIADRTIYAGGRFRSVAGKVANRIAKLDQTGALDVGFSPQSGPNGTDNTVRALAVRGNTLYAGGDFRKYRGADSSRLARISSAGVLETVFDCRTGFDDSVHALALTADGSTLYAGGDFDSFRGKRANRLAKILTAGAALDPTFNPASGANGADGSVRALAADPAGARVYVGGRFGKYRGATVNAIVRVKSDGALDGGFAADPGGTGEGCPFVSVDAIAVDPTGADVFFGGRFLDVGGSLANHVARVSSVGQLDPAFSPPAGPTGVNLLPGEPIPVQAIALDGPRVHVGGFFTAYRAAPAQHLVITDFAGAASQ